MRHYYVKATLVSLLMLVCSSLLLAQPVVLSSEEKKTDFYLLTQQFEKAEEGYKVLLQKSDIDSPEYARISLKLASMFYSLYKYEEAELYFEMVLPNPSFFSNEQAAICINTFILLGDYYRAKETVDGFLALPNFAKSLPLQNLKKGLDNIANIDELALYDIDKASFNKEGANIWATGYKKGTMYINSGGSESELIKGAQFYFTENGKDEHYTKIPLTMQAGPATFSKDGKAAIYTDNYYGKKIKGGFFSQNFVFNHLHLVQLSYDKKRDKWENPKSVFSSSSDISYCHPSLSDDGQILYFSSNKEGGKGGMDLYLSKKIASGWDTPINLGKEVNTSGDELFAFVRDGWLIFASNGHEGFGGYDIYRVQLSKAGFPIGKSLEHFPYPINTLYDDYGMTYLNDTTGYLTSTRDRNSTFEVIYQWNKIPDDVVAKVSAARDSARVREAAKDLLLGRTASDIAVYYGYNKYNISSDSRIALDGFFAKLKGKTPLILVLGYADTSGDPNHNQYLSEQRAIAVKRYLVEIKGYPANRIETVGRGQIELDASEQLHDADIKIRLAPARKAEVKILEDSKKP